LSGSAQGLVQRLGPLRPFAKWIGFTVFGSKLVLSMRRRAMRQAEVVTILNLHRVAESDQSAYEPLDPRLFDQLLAYLVSRFSIVTFGNLAEVSPKPKMILSFDDGYKDFADVAAPILLRHRVRANQNIIPGCVESGLPPLNVVAQDFVGKAPAELVLKLDVPGFRLRPSADLGMRISAFIKTKAQTEQQLLAEHLLPQFFSWDEFRPTSMMSRDDVRQIASEHEIGAHSYDHASMECESDDYLRSDVERCARYFDERLGRPMSIYAFPNGSCRPSQIDILLGLGIDHVLLVGEAFSDRKAVHRRFTFHARGPSEARFKSHGGFVPVNG